MYCKRRRRTYVRRRFCLQHANPPSHVRIVQRPYDWEVDGI